MDLFRRLGIFEIDIEGLRFGVDVVDEKLCTSAPKARHLYRLLRQGIGVIE